VQVAWLNRTISADAIQGAAQRVLCRLSGRSIPSTVAVPTLDRTHGDSPDFEFQHRPFVGDWRTVLQGAVTNELNRPYGDAEAPWRLFLFESPVFGQFLGLGYRHVIADARSVALVLHEIIRLALFPDGGSAGFAAEHRPESLRELFPAEF